MFFVGKMKSGSSKPDTNADVSLDHLRNHADRPHTWKNCGNGIKLRDKYSIKDLIVEAFNI